MRLKGRQARFLIGVFLCWTMSRAIWLWPSGTAAMPAPTNAAAIASGTTLPRQTASVPAAIASLSVSKEIQAVAPVSRPPQTELLSSSQPPHAATRSIVVAESDAPAVPTPAPLFPPVARHGRGIEAQAYLFWRPGGGASSLAERGELGGSQVAARIAVPLGDSFAVAGRVYAPLEHLGAEAAIGLDWHPLAGQPIRISVERRQKLDPLGRSAWSAYAAGGFWHGGGAGRPVFDGYAQAGIVGTRRRDLFIDGALRAGYRLPVDSLSVVMGGGLWGAAQPQVSRLDIGPRVAAVLPVDGHDLTLALDGRFRMAGRAAPGSGAALTIAADF